MGGLKWEALDVVSELLGVADVEFFIYQLVSIRDHQSEK